MDNLFKDMNTLARGISEKTGEIVYGKLFHKERDDTYWIAKSPTSSLLEDYAFKTSINNTNASFYIENEVIKIENNSVSKMTEFKDSLGRPIYINDLIYIPSSCKDDLFCLIYGLIESDPEIKNILKDVSIIKYIVGNTLEDGSNIRPIDGEEDK